MRLNQFLFFLLFFGSVWTVYAQPAPGSKENIHHLVTFGSQSNSSWGDDDNCQIIFFTVPAYHKGNVYIRIFDPDTGGQLDEANGVFDTETTFTLFGGKGCHSNLDAQQPNPVGDYASGNVLWRRTFGLNPDLDQTWIHSYNFSPSEGELEGDHYIFKLIIQGKKGNDGNLYKLFLSELPEENHPIGGGNSFAYEYTFRMSMTGEPCNVFPYVNEQLNKIQIYIFDYDESGYVSLSSPIRPKMPVKKSEDGKWEVTEFDIRKGERNASMKVEMWPGNTQKNNNVVVYILNHYGKHLRFYSSPLGFFPFNPGPIKVKPYSKSSLSK